MGRALLADSYSLIPTDRQKNLPRSVQSILCSEGGGGESFNFMH